MSLGFRKSWQLWPIRFYWSKHGSRPPYRSLGVVQEKSWHGMPGLDGNVWHASCSFHRPDKPISCCI